MKSKPIGVRFDEKLTEKMKEKGIISYQKILNFLTDFWLENDAKIVASNILPDKSEVSYEKKNDEITVKKVVVTPTEKSDFDGSKQEAKIDTKSDYDGGENELRFDFGLDTILMVEKYTKYPLSKKPKTPLEITDFMAKKKAYDALIREAWNNRVKAS